MRNTFCLIALGVVVCSFTKKQIDISREYPEVKCCTLGTIVKNDSFVKNNEIIAYKSNGVRLCSESFEITEQKEKGTVLVNALINQHGQVLNVAIDVENCTTASSVLWQLSLDYTAHAQFERSTDMPVHIIKMKFTY